MNAESMEFNRLFQSKIEEIETLKARIKELEDVGTALYEELTLERSGKLPWARIKELEHNLLMVSKLSAGSFENSFNAGMAKRIRDKVLKGGE